MKFLKELNYSHTIIFFWVRKLKYVAAKFEMGMAANMKFEPGFVFGGGYKYADPVIF